MVRGSLHAIGWILSALSLGALARCSSGNGTYVPGMGGSAGQATGGASPGAGGTSAGSSSDGGANAGGSGAGAGGNTGSSSGGAGGSAGTATGGTAGAGQAGASGTAGSAGTSGAGGSAGADTPCTGLCDNFTEIPGVPYSTPTLGTAAACFEYSGALSGGVCYGLAPARTFTVNQVVMTCEENFIAPLARNGGYCIVITAGDYTYANFSLF